MQLHITKFITSKNLQKRNPYSINQIKLSNLKFFSPHFVVLTTRDVKKICTCGYPQIKPATSRKRILKIDTRYPRVGVFFIPAC